MSRTNSPRRRCSAAVAQVDVTKLFEAGTGTLRLAQKLDATTDRLLEEVLAAPVRSTMPRLARSRKTRGEHPSQSASAANASSLIGYGAPI